MKHLVSILFLGSLTVLFFGCSTLKPTSAPPRYFLLAPIPAQTATNSTQPPLDSRQSRPAVLAIAPIRLPDYLNKKSIAIRKSTNEIEYLESALWAERLDEGFLRVLTAGLASRLPGYTIRRTASHKEGIELELQLTVQQFEVNTVGEGVLTAEWRVVSPAAGKTIKEGKFHASRQGPDPKRDPGGAVSTLTALIHELSGSFVFN
jgi:uncharacterized lipoprotein YmbA